MIFKYNKIAKNAYQLGFSLAEALITLTMVSLILAATMPIITKGTNAPSEAPWKYVTLGDLAQMPLFIPFWAVLRFPFSGISMFRLTVP